MTRNPSEPGVVSTPSSDKGFSLPEKFYNNFPVGREGGQKVLNFEGRGDQFRSGSKIVQK